MIKNKVAYKTLIITFAVIGCLTLFVLSPGCAPTLTLQEKREDIQFLADWADNYSPFVEANEQIKGCPSYRDLLPKYLEYAEQAKNNREFLYIVQGYFFLVFNSGHADMYPEQGSGLSPKTGKPVKPLFPEAPRYLLSMVCPVRNISSLLKTISGFVTFRRKRGLQKYYSRLKNLRILKVGKWNSSILTAKYKKRLYLVAKGRLAGRVVS
jgi:hypothetical protein